MLRLLVTRSAVIMPMASHIRSSLLPAHIAQQQLRHQSTGSPEGGSKRSSSDAEALRRDWDVPVITYEELKLKTAQPSAEKYLIDVREPDEVLQGSIPSAVNLPLSQLPGALHLPPLAFKAKFGFEKPRPHQEVTFYCRSGARSTTASDVAKRNGYTNILNYKGSWLEWTEREGKKSTA